MATTKHLQHLLRHTFPAGIFLALAATTSGCGAEKPTSATPIADRAESRPLDFKSDEEFLDLIQLSHLNFMWEEAEVNCGLAREQESAQKNGTLWREMQWDWFNDGTKDKLYGLWSPKHEWAINMPLIGYNESLIAYILGASSPTHPIDPAVYDNCWCRNGKIKDEACPYGYALEQLTLAPMIENYRSGLLWRLFMSCPEIQEGLQKLGFRKV